MNKRIIPPPIEDVRKYVTDHGYTIDPDQFFDHHEARGWWLGKVKMKDWQAAIRTWVRNEKRWNPTGNETEKKWHETSQGIIDMGLRYGLKESDYPHFPAFKQAVFEAHKTGGSCQGRLRLVI